MVLFYFDEEVKNKYKNHANNNNISFNDFKTIALEQISKIFPLYFNNINPKYINNIIVGDKNKIVFYCMGDKFSLSNITSILIYHKTKSSNTIKYYILLLGTHNRFRKYGYGKILLNEFIQWIKSHDNSKIEKKLVLKSLESSMGFYISNGFIQSNLKHNKLFYKYETNTELNSNLEKILELNL